ncbi:hypothetical protein DFP72DRAFT_860802 [Ephemerocybe angulata]|uniref:Uncharacterized protein n=1 Tax=Ephemerocybe angulata TaxID=980116 RepID=A0A8H6H9V6_9AGAR|nr:hypothetical protein DFP72DRAFT_860802 [Tulosesus angulatus]
MHTGRPAICRVDSLLAYSLISRSLTADPFPQYPRVSATACPTPSRPPSHVHDGEGRALKSCPRAPIVQVNASYSPAQKASTTPMTTAPHPSTGPMTTRGKEDEARQRPHWVECGGLGSEMEILAVCEISGCGCIRGRGRPDAELSWSSLSPHPPSPRSHSSRTTMTPFALRADPGNRPQPLLPQTQHSPTSSGADTRPRRRWHVNRRCPGANKRRTHHIPFEELSGSSQQHRQQIRHSKFNRHIPAPETQPAHWPPVSKQTRRARQFCIATTMAYSDAAQKGWWEKCVGECGCCCGLGARACVGVWHVDGCCAGVGVVIDDDVELVWVGGHVELGDVAVELSVSIEGGVEAGGVVSLGDVTLGVPSSGSDNESNPALYEQSLGRLACALGGQSVLLPTFQYIPSMLVSYGLIAIAAIGEGAGKSYPPSDARVRWGAQFEVGEHADFARSPRHATQAIDDRRLCRDLEPQQQRRTVHNHLTARTPGYQKLRHKLCLGFIALDYFPLYSSTHIVRVVVACCSFVAQNELIFRKCVLLVDSGAGGHISNIGS